MYKILTLNNISVAGLERLPRESYEVASEIQHPDAILVRSANMHDMEIPVSVRAIGRAGAGVNNIPVAQMTERGVPVFNAPGANANAVKELVLAGMLMAARNIGPVMEIAGETIHCREHRFVRALHIMQETFLERTVFFYGAARAGKIKEFTGIDHPYEEPENPEIVVDTANQTIDESVSQIMNTIKQYL